MTHYWAAALPSRQEKQKQENEREWCLFPELNPSVGLSVFPRPWGEKRKASWASFLPSLLNHSSSNCLIILKTYQGFSSWLCLCVWQCVCVCVRQREALPLVRCTPWLSPTTPLLLPHPLFPHSSYTNIPQLLTTPFFYILQNFEVGGHRPTSSALCLILIIEYGDWVHAPQQLFRINWILLKHFAYVFFFYLQFLKYIKAKLAIIILVETLQKRNKLGMYISFVCRLLNHIKHTVDMSYS